MKIRASRFRVIKMYNPIIPVYNNTHLGIFHWEGPANFPNIFKRGSTTEYINIYILDVYTAGINRVNGGGSKPHRHPTPSPHKYSTVEYCL